MIDYRKRNIPYTTITIMERIKSITSKRKEPFTNLIMYGWIGYITIYFIYNMFSLHIIENNDIII